MSNLRIGQDQWQQGTNEYLVLTGYQTELYTQYEVEKFVGSYLYTVADKSGYKHLLQTNRGFGQGYYELLEKWVGFGLAIEPDNDKSTSLEHHIANRITWCRGNAKYGIGVIEDCKDKQYLVSIIETLPNPQEVLKGLTMWFAGDSLVYQIKFWPDVVDVCGLISGEVGNGTKGK